MATHSSILVWRILWTEKPGGLQPMGSQRIGHYWVTNTYRFHETCKITPTSHKQTSLKVKENIDKSILPLVISFFFFNENHLLTSEAHNIPDLTLYWLSSVQSLSCAWFLVTPWTVAHLVSMSITNSLSLHKLMSIESVRPSNHLILCCPILLLPSIFPSIRVFSNESILRMMWPKYWSFSFSISSSNEHSGLISFRMDWLDFLAVQGTLKSLLQHHSSKASILQCSGILIVQLSHQYMTTRKTIALTRWTFVSKVMPLLCNMLSTLAVAFLPRSKNLLISWLQSSTAVILEPPKIKSLTVSIVSPSICHEVMEPDAIIIVFF